MPRKLQQAKHPLLLVGFDRLEANLGRQNLNRDIMSIDWTMDRFVEYNFWILVFEARFPYVALSALELMIGTS